MQNRKIQKARNQNVWGRQYSICYAVYAIPNGAKAKEFQLFMVRGKKVYLNTLVLGKNGVIEPQ